MNVLIVDDSKAMRMIVRRTLRQAGFDAEVSEAENGKEALELLRSQPFDAVLSDWNMPEMNGLELLEAVKSEDIDVKFGFVTSESSPEMTSKAKDAGALFTISKPFTPESFQMQLEGIL